MLFFLGYTTAMDIGNIIHNLNFSITDDFIDITGATTIDIVCAATINGSTAYTEPAQLKIQGMTNIVRRFR